MPLRFFNDFDDYFGDSLSDRGHGVTFSLLPLRMSDSDDQASPSEMCKTKNKCTKPLKITTPSSFGSTHRLASLDVIENESECVVQVDLPGIAKDDIQVHFDDSNRLLTVEAERKAMFKEEAKPNFYHHERYYGRVQRSVTLPENVDGESVKASMDDGVLKLVFEKKPEKETRQRIEIK